LAKLIEPLLNNRTLENQTELLSVIDVERRTTRGRSCPRCGGKIIPSRRAVYQSTDPSAVFPLWQCERCGYEELVARAIKPAAKHAPAARDTSVSTTDKKTAAPSSQTAAPASTPAANAAETHKVPALKDRKGRALPPDVNRIMAEMSRGERGKQ
jgi:DNA-directed RNA polymerase subunit M/transcription elongation factor TFIIS